MINAMKPVKLRELFYQVGNLEGWDFSRLRVTSEGKKWEFYEEVARWCQPNDILLDIGTGGGEKAMRIAGNVRIVIGIDHAQDMVDSARLNWRRARLKNGRFFRMESGALTFPDGLFDIVSCRQSAFDVDEVWRVLREGGVFLTQQVAEGDKANIKDAFGRGQNHGVPDGTAMRRTVQAFERAGSSRMQVYEYDAHEYYETERDFLFLLRHAPIVPDFGESPDDFDILSDFITENKTERGIETNSKRYMIVARK